MVCLLLVRKGLLVSAIAIGICTVACTASAIIRDDHDQEIEDPVAGVYSRRSFQEVLDDEALHEGEEDGVAGRSLVVGGGNRSDTAGAPYARNSEAPWNFNRLDPAKHPMAKCLDGSMGGYYVRPGPRGEKVVVHLQGSGWCTGVATSQTACNQFRETCTARAKTDLGSTLKDGPGFRKDSAFFSTSPQANPAFWDWTHVFVRYCDGSSFSGRRTAPMRRLGSPPVYLRGNFILEAVIKDLTKRDNLLAKASQVVLTGGSAGGLAVILHAHQWRKALPRKTKMVAIPQGGFFTRWNTGDRKGRCRMTFSEQMRNMYAMNDAKNGLPPRCLEAQMKNNTFERCMLAANAVPGVPVPILILNSKYDSFQIKKILGKNPTDAFNVNKFGAVLKKQVFDALQKQRRHTKGSGTFLDSCYHHRFGKRKPDIYGTVKVDGVKVNAAVASWVTGAFGRGNRHRKVWLSNRRHPCRGCCQ